jgi:hypothetical protein
MKIFVGSIENCGVLNSLSEGFKSLGHEVTSFVKARDPFFTKFKYDYDISSIKTHNIFQTSGLLAAVESRVRRTYCDYVIQPYLLDEFLENDVFVFVFDTILKNQADLALLKKLGKKIVFIFFGSEARDYRAFNQQYPDTHLPWPKTHTRVGLNEKLEFIRRIEYYADSIHALPDISGLFLRPFHLTRLPFAIDNLPHKIADNKIPVIIHAPSNRAIKGTDKIVTTLHRLNADGLKFEFKLLENMPNHLVKEEILNADILIDQIFLHYPSVFSIEGMAMGCAVAMRFYENEFENPPICNVNENNLYDKVKLLIESREYRLELANAGRNYIKKFHSPEYVAKEVLEGLFTTKGNNFQPTFFAEKFANTDSFVISKETKKLTADVMEKYFSEAECESMTTKLRSRKLI